MIQCSYLTDDFSLDISGPLAKGLDATPTNATTLAEYEKITPALAFMK